MQKSLDCRISYTTEILAKRLGISYNTHEYNIESGVLFDRLLDLLLEYEEVTGKVHPLDTMVPAIKERLHGEDDTRLRVVQDG